jgi:hypothetical protein
MNMKPSTNNNRQFKSRNHNRTTAFKYLCHGYWSFLSKCVVTQIYVPEFCVERKCVSQCGDTTVINSILRHMDFNQRFHCLSNMHTQSVSQSNLHQLQTEGIRSYANGKPSVILNIQSCYTLKTSRKPRSLHRMVTSLQIRDPLSIQFRLSTTITWKR